MKLINKYIFTNTIKFFLITIIIFLLLGILTRVTHYLSIITTSNGSIVDFLNILLLIQFKIIVSILPFVLLIVAFLVFDSIIKSNEHIACYNIGISKHKLLFPFLNTVFIIFIINIFLSSVAVPLSYKKMNIIHSKLLLNISNSLIKSGEFISQKGLTFFLHKIKADNLVEGILFIDKRNPDTKIILIANEGFIGFDGTFISFQTDNAYFNYKNKDFEYPISSRFEKFNLFLKPDITIPNNENISSFVSNKNLIKSLLSGDKSKITEFVNRFGIPFFTILIPLSMAVCLIVFFGFSRSKINFTKLAFSSLIIGYTVFSAFLMNDILPVNFFGLFAYYVNIFLIFGFLYFISRK
jgi:lipopolysaccharide export LptBFGC system permease protein LptF